MEYDNLLRKEVESHSSALTNRRIFDIKNEVWQRSLDIQSNPKDPKTALAYFSSLVVLYIETPGLYEKDDKGKLEELMKEGNIIASRIRLFGRPTKEETENLLQICLNVHLLINISLQKVRYLFRTGVQDPKGIENALDIFKQDIWKRIKKDGNTTKLHKKPGKQP